MNGEALAWDGTMDNRRFRARVIQQDDGYHGTLEVTVTETGEVLLSEPVGISYAARFGPDMDDVATWQERTLQVVNEWLVANGEEIPTDE